MKNDPSPGINNITDIKIAPHRVAQIPRDNLEILGIFKNIAHIGIVLFVEYISTYRIYENEQNIIQYILIFFNKHCVFTKVHQLCKCHSLIMQLANDEHSTFIRCFDIYC